MPQYYFFFLSVSNNPKGAQTDLLNLTASWPCTGFIFDVILTMSLLSMPTFRRLAATEPMSFSESQDLKSFTAKHAETPEQMQKDVSAVADSPVRIMLGLSNAWI